MDLESRIIVLKTVFTELDDPKTLRIPNMRELNDKPSRDLESECIGDDRPPRFQESLVWRLRISADNNLAVLAGRED